MSTKTIFKRVAIVAAAALTLGGLTGVAAQASVYDVTPAPFANGVPYYGFQQTNGAYTATYYATVGDNSGTYKLTADTDTVNATTVSVTGATATLTPASQTLLTGTVVKVPNVTGDTYSVSTSYSYYCQFTGSSYAYGSSVVGNKFNGTELTTVTFPSAYLHDGVHSYVDGDSGALCAKTTGSVTDATVSFSDATAGTVVVNATDANGYLLESVNVIISPAAVTKAYSQVATYTAGDHNSVQGWQAGDGAIYAPAAINGEEAIAADFTVAQLTAGTIDSSPTYLADSSSNAWSVDLTGPGTLKTFSDSCPGTNIWNPYASITHITVPAGFCSAGSLRVVADGRSGASTVTVTVGGSVVKTFKINFYGAAKTVTLTPNYTIGHAGNYTGTGSNAGHSDSSLNDGYSLAATSSNDAAYTVVAKDANGFAIPLGATYDSWGRGINIPVVPQVMITSSDNSVIDEPCDYAFTDDGSGKYATGIWALNCDFHTTAVAASGATAKITATVYNFDGTLVSSTPAAFTVGGAPAKVTATLDASSYQIGTKATVSLTAVDAAGNPAYDQASLLSSISSNLLTGGSLPDVTAVTSVGGKASFTLYAPAVSGTWVLSGKDATGAAYSWTATLTSTADDSASLATDAANAATDAANAAAESADNATQAASDALAAVQSLQSYVSKLFAAVKKQIYALLTIVHKLKK